MGLSPRLRLPGAVELPWARRRRLKAERGTVALGVAAFGLTAVVLGGEIARVLRERVRVHPELDAIDSADVAVRETVAVAVAGYESMTTRETALLNLLTSFSLTFAAARLSTYVIRRRGTGGRLMRDVFVGERHIHHFVPGIVLAFLAGGASVISRDEAIDPLLAIPFGLGVALTLDESALLLRRQRADHARGSRAARRRLDRRRRAAPRSGAGGYATAATAAPASCGWSCIQMICSRPGPTPTSAIGTLIWSAMNAR